MKSLHYEQEIAKLNRLAILLDSQFRIPFTRIRVGLDSLIGIVPLYGDAVSFLLSLGLLVYIARLGVPLPVMARLCSNVLLDFLVGLVPIFGDFADIYLKINLRNVDLAKKYFHQPRKVKAQSWLFVGVLSFLLISALVAFVSLVFWLSWQLWNWVFSIV